MKAIILAAGMGSRLSKYTKDLPKGMLEFNNKPLIEHQIETLRACGITDIIIIKGYKPEKINFPNIKYYENGEYNSTNMVETLMKAQQELNDDILVCYADIIYQKSILKTILENKADIGVTVDEDYWPYWQARLEKPEDDIESLQIENNKITELGTPNCSKEKAKQRYVGLIKFSKKGIEIFQKAYQKNKDLYYDKNEPWLASKSFKQAYMTCMLNAIIQEGYEIKPITIKRGWLEFDTNEDYEKATVWLKEGTIQQFFNPDS